MPELKVECFIDERSYSYEHIADIQYHRNLHWLHEMMRLGAEIEYGGRPLSHDQANVLSKEEARHLSVAMRRSYGPDGLRGLFKEQLRESDRMWKAIAAAPRNAPYGHCFADMRVTGMSPEEFQEAISLENFQRRYAEINPDHCFLEIRENGIHSMEIFGMYGGPSEVYLTLDQSIDIPFEGDPEFPELVKGYTTLASDETEIGLFVAHQYKPIDNGVAMRLGCLFPPNTPQEIVDGHKLHSVIEFWELVQPGGGPKI